MKTSIQSLLPIVAFAVTILFIGPRTFAQETGDLKITFQYGGDQVPEQVPINPTADGQFCGQHDLKEESLIVNGENKGIKNVIVYFYTKKNKGIDVPDTEPKTVELANQGCRFEPRIVITRPGDTLKVTNPDEVGHNANLQFISNNPLNPTIPAGQSVEVELKKAEPAPIPVSCNIHPWMQARIVVVDHPFAAVSDENGELIIKGLPAGKKIVFRANHEKAKFKKITVDGEKTSWKRNAFEVEIKPGMNDLGTVVIGKDQIR